MDLEQADANEHNTDIPLRSCDCKKQNTLLTVLANLAQSNTSVFFSYAAVMSPQM